MHGTNSSSRDEVLRLLPKKWTEEAMHSVLCEMPIMFLLPFIAADCPFAIDLQVFSGSTLFFILDNSFRTVSNPKNIYCAYGFS